MARQNERTGTDQLVRRLIESLGVTYWEQGEGAAELKNALRGWSKAANGRGPAKPEFAFVSDGFLVLVEDKAASDRVLLSDAEGRVVTDFPARADYALNGAVFYAQNVLERSTQFDRIFAIGVGGDSQHHMIQPAFVGKGGVTLLPEVDSLADFAPDSIAELHRVAVLGELPRVERELRDIKQIAAQLHEDMRNYGSLEGERKATTVSAILLALSLESFALSDLKGSSDPEQSDGWKIYNAARAYLHKAKLQPEQKIGALLDQFAFLRDHPTLNKPIDALAGLSPLKRFALTLESRVLSAIVKSPFDVLGNFYGEFVRYGGADGNSLGIVLTPHHLTTLMVDLIDVHKSDYVLDPTAGTAAFLIAAMNRMMAEAGEVREEQEDIRANRLFGIELQDKLFAIGVTNMILRGDGKANFRRDDIFHVDPAELRGDLAWADGSVVAGHGFTKVLMNPPYSQAKNDQTRHLSELRFVARALDLTNRGGRLAAVLPQSSMVGKTRWDKSDKAQLLARHTLDAVITLNPETFYGVGANPVVVLMTAGEPHPANKRVAFIDFQNDGYVTRQHLGLVSDGTEKSRREHLINVLRGNEDDDTDFVVYSTIAVGDEWLHSHFYFNDVPPSLDEFSRVTADYVAWWVDMYAHGNGSLLAKSAAPPQAATVGLDAREVYEQLRFSPMYVTDVFESMKSSTAWLDRSKEKPGPGEYVFLSQSDRYNGLTGVVGHQGMAPEAGNALTVTLKTHAVFYQPVEFYTAQNFLLFRHAELNELNALPLVAILRSQFKKFSWAWGVSMARLRRTQVLVPVDDDGKVAWSDLTRLGGALRTDHASLAGAAVNRFL